MRQSRCEVGCIVQNACIARTRKEENIGSVGSQVILLRPVPVSTTFQLCSFETTRRIVGITEWLRFNRLKHGNFFLLRTVSSYDMVPIVPPLDLVK